MKPNEINRLCVGRHVQTGPKSATLPSAHNRKNPRLKAMETPNSNPFLSVEGIRQGFNLRICVQYSIKPSPSAYVSDLVFL